MQNAAGGVDRTLCTTDFVGVFCAADHGKRRCAFGSSACPVSPRACSSVVRPELQTNGAGNDDSCRLWIERADVSCEGDHVALREFLDSLFHEGACASCPAAVLELIELAHDVGR